MGSRRGSAQPRMKVLAVPPIVDIIKVVYANETWFQEHQRFDPPPQPFNSPPTRFPREGHYIPSLRSLFSTF